MSWSITISNIPWWITGERYWIAWIINPDWYGEWISSGWLDVNDKWTIDGAYSSATILSVLLYNANYEELSRWENVSILVQDGKDYTFDATEGKLKEISIPMWPKADIQKVDITILAVAWPKADIQRVDVTILVAPPSAAYFEKLVVTYKKK